VEKESLLVKYRPSTLDEIYGQDSAVTSIKNLLDRRCIPHAFIFSGGSGVGKTSIARIVADYIGADKIEVDAASNSGIDAMKDIVSQCLYKPVFGGHGRKFLIIDEAHRLSRQAFESLLKIVEEPPDHLYFAFCTTEFDKIPISIKTRCAKIKLLDVKHDVLMDLLRTVSDIEGFSVSDEVLGAIAQGSYGSARMALSILSTAHGSKSSKDVEMFILKEEYESNLMGLVNIIMGGGGWKEIQEVYISLSDEDIEKSVYVISEILINKMKKTTIEKGVLRLHYLLESLHSIPMDIPNKTKLCLFLGRSIVG
jgi:DNA polymerase III gamma/tau subunit